LVQASCGVLGVQPHWLAVPPPPHVSGSVHMPHDRMPPQPSGAMPQSWPMGHACVVQPHWFGVPPPPHVCGIMHVPQGTVPPHPSDAVPQF
jgi:hypothetical protein